MNDIARQELVEQLKPVVNEPEFDDIFGALTEGLSGPERFKLKGELRHLARPCRKVIDLRKRVEGSCRPYQHKGITHYMDDVAIQIFENGLQQYRGTYTEDTYEQVHNADNNFRIIAQRERERSLQAARRTFEVGKQPLPSQMKKLGETEGTQYKHLEKPYFTFGEYISRREERMNFVVPVVLNTARGKSIEANTSNISISGMKVKLSPDDVVNEGEQVGVRFVGLAKEFTFDPSFVAPYKVVKVERTPDALFLGLARDSMFDSDEFDEFLLRFINGYKRRYKVNVENTYRTVLSKSYEQFYFPRSAALPLFFKRDGVKMFAALALETANNKGILDDWLNESNLNILPNVFLGRRIAQLLKHLKQHPGGIARVLIYSFHVLMQGQVHFYAATSEEFEQDPELKRVFLAYAARTNNFRVYSFDFSQLDKSRAWQPIALPDSILEQDKYLSRPPSPEVMQKISTLSHLGVLRDVTPLRSSYKSYTCKKEELELIKPYRLSRKPPVTLEHVAYSFTNFRAEARFGYRTRVRLRVGETNVMATTRDISTMGMQVEAEEAVPTKAGEYIQLDLLELAKRAGTQDVTRLRYEVMHISEDQTTLHLRADVNDASHRGKAFFEKMISDNQDEILRNRQEGTLHGLALCLRNLYSHSMTSLSIYLQRPKDQEFQLGMVGFSPLNHHLKELSIGLSYQPEHASLRFLLGEKDVSRVLRKAWDGLTESSYPQALEVYVYIGASDADKGLRGSKVVVRYQQDFKDTEQEQKFIVQALKHGCLMFLRMEVSRTGKPDIAFIAKEFKYVSMYASHKAQQLEKDLWSVVGLVDVVDCTKELMTRLKLSQNEQQKQAQRLDDLLAMR